MLLGPHSERGTPPLPPAPDSPSSDSEAHPASVPGHPLSLVAWEVQVGTGDSSVGSGESPDPVAQPPDCALACLCPLNCGPRCPPPKSVSDSAYPNGVVLNSVFLLKNIFNCSVTVDVQYYFTLV